MTQAASIHEHEILLGNFRVMSEFFWWKSCLKCTKK